MSFFDERFAAEDAVARRATQRENTSREATVTLTLMSVGVGRARHEAPFAFPVPFAEEPIMTQGSGVVAHPDRTNWWEPEGSAGVTAWVRNDSGLYTGVKLWTAVTMVPVAGATAIPEGVRVQHWLRFHGIALKDLGQEAVDAAAALTPREVDF